MYWNKSNHIQIQIDQNSMSNGPMKSQRRMTQRFFHPSYVNVKVVLENHQAATHWPRGSLNALLPVGLGTAHGTSCPSCVAALAEF